MEQERIYIEEAILVEGKYDRQRLEPLVDALILETDGFRIFKDKEKRELIRQLAVHRGILILTDSDAAGFKIRSYLKNIVGNKGRIRHAYIPDIPGKEKRKAKPSKEGLLGVEGMEPALLRSLFEELGLTGKKSRPSGRPITKLHFFEDGLSGGEGSTGKRKALCRKFKLPEHLSANGLLEILNVLTDYDGYRAAVEEIAGAGEDREKTVL